MKYLPFGPVTAPDQNSLKRSDVVCFHHPGEEEAVTDQQFLNLWYLYLAVAGVVVVIAAALLIAILLAAKGIERSAEVALERVKQIRENTQVLWALQDTNKVAAQLQVGAESILGHAGQIAQALHEGDTRRGRSQG
jgi:hypothetical protein